MRAFIPKGNIFICYQFKISLIKQMIQQHQDWLEDLAIRLLCVFALDRFGDFVSDEVSMYLQSFYVHPFFFNGTYKNVVSNLR